MTDPFWAEIQAVLDAASKATTADELIAAVKQGPDQTSGDPGAQAFFAGSGGNTQLVEVLDDGDHWEIEWLESDYWWKATAKADGSVIEYTEGDVYKRS
ncbi:hypothetical protein [Mycobacteroides abscessus]|uniref:hypothetical protein n=1 Tax=Mycobacteroides abscessus TaxID=36809 RepID=UPI001F32128B|nr:hypothetical protein [Mycobacteroides abscessus]